MKHLQHLDDITVNATELAKLVGCSLQYLARLRKEKVIEWVAPSRFGLVDSVQRYLEHQRAGAKYVGASEAAQALRAEQLRKLRLANDEKERRSIDLDEVKEVLDTLIAIIRMVFGSAPRRFWRDVAGQRQAEAAIDECLNVCADALERLSKGLENGGMDYSQAVASVFNAAQGNRETATP